MRKVTRTTKHANNFLVRGEDGVSRDMIWATMSRIATLVPNSSKDPEYRTSAIVRIARKMRSTNQHIVLALSYMERINVFQPSPELLRGRRTNWRQQYFFVCLLLAHKYLDDELLRTEHYASILKFRSKDHLLRWQRHVLVEKLNFDISITPVHYEEHLRSMQEGGDVLFVDSIKKKT